MITGIGTDLVDIERMAAAWQRHGVRLAERILAPAELGELSGHHHPERLLAKRFAAKEAFAKALGTGMRGPVSFRNMAVSHNELGRPELAFSDALQHWITARQVGSVHLSISDGQHTAMAFVVIEQRASA